MRARIFAAVLLAATLWSAPTVAEASFNKQAASAQSASSGMLHPPTGLSTSRSSCTVTLSWTPTIDAKASGYILFNGNTQLMTIAPKTVSSQRFSITRNVTYSLRMVTTYLKWTSSISQAVSVSC
ncbi:hypothetical protein [Jatrophihabitans sp.]|jgi:hypothetical protein|uniref:hypothetical protein n=1 Tax=Jatrophihabitans sp. TaxID=1932789 RepID=UPI0038CD417D